MSDTEFDCFWKFAKSIRIVASDNEQAIDMNDIMSLKRWFQFLHYSQPHHYYLHVKFHSLMKLPQESN